MNEDDSKSCRYTLVPQTKKNPSLHGSHSIQFDSQSLVEQSSCLERLQKWFHAPNRLLKFILLINFIIYFDRGFMLAVSTHYFEKDTSIAMTGSLINVFLLGYMITCPIFPMLEKWFQPSKIICLGLSIWSGAVVLCAFSLNNYYMMAFGRILVGVGEAGYAGFVCTMIDDLASKKRRTSWLAAYFVMVPLGQAVGILFPALSVSNTGVRMIYFFQAVAMCPIILLMHGYSNNSDLANQDSSIPVGPWEAMKMLLGNKIWLCTTLGYGFYRFICCTFIVWGCDLLIERSMVKSNMAGLIRSGTLLITGILGTALGGISVDMTGGSFGVTGLKKCHMFNSINILIAFPCAMIALMTIQAQGHIAFFILMFSTAILLFNITAPVNAAILSSVPNNMRTYAMSFCILIIHSMGDFPSLVMARILSNGFSYGCSDQQDEPTCLAHRKDCQWKSYKNYDTPRKQDYCSSEFGMRDAFVIVCMSLVPITLLWGLAWWFSHLEKESDMVSTEENE